jgi:hypothetical protein
VIIKKSIFLNITPYDPLKIKGRFGGICRLFLQGRRINHAIDCHAANVQSRVLLATYLFLISSGGFPRSWRWKRNVFQKRQLIFKGLHDVTPENVEVFLWLALTSHIRGIFFREYNFFLTVCPILRSEDHANGMCISRSASEPQMHVITTKSTRSFWNCGAYFSAWAWNL